MFKLQGWHLLWICYTERLQVKILEKKKKKKSFNKIYSQIMFFFFFFFWLFSFVF
jgi:hypothetical protein